MTTLPESRRDTEAEYLDFERAAQTKHEFRDGQVIAMVGASTSHNRITPNIGATLHGRLRGGPCEPFVNDLRVRSSPAGHYAYPDVVVVCGAPRLADSHGDIPLDPTVIVEVLSPLTEAYDRGDKFHDYRSIESLREYVLVAQNAVRVEQFTRQEGGRWLPREIASLDATLELASIGCALPLRDLYERVDLP